MEALEFAKAIKRMCDAHECVSCPTAKECDYIDAYTSGYEECMERIDD